MVVHSKKNCSNTLLGFAILSFGLLFNADQAHAWGSLGHRTIATIASKIVRKNGAFWRSNASNMGKLTNVPDQYWKAALVHLQKNPLTGFRLIHTSQNRINLTLFLTTTAKPQTNTQRSQLS